MSVAIELDVERRFALKMSKSSRGMGNLGKMNILYVENHGRFSKMVTQQFLGNYSVVLAASLAEARAALQNQSVNGDPGVFDLVLVDYDLDDGKGDELVRELAGRSSRPKLIGVSSHADGNQAMLDAGADAVCSKLQFDEIEQVIARVLE